MALGKSTRFVCPLPHVAWRQLTQLPGGEGSVSLPQFPRDAAAETPGKVQVCPEPTPDAQRMPDMPRLAHACWAHSYTAHSMDIARGSRLAVTGLRTKGGKALEK